MIGWLLELLPYAVTALAAAAGVFWLRKDAVKDRDKDAQLRRARETVLAQKLREEVENDIEQDVDLVARARRAGVVREGTD